MKLILIILDYDIFNKRSLGQKKRKAKRDMTEGLVGCTGSLIIWLIKILFIPFTLIYYGFIKKNINNNWKLFYKISALIVWIFFAIIYLTNKNV